MTGFVLNPPRRRKARRSKRRGRRRNARGWFSSKRPGARVAYSHPARKKNPRRRRKSRSRRRRNPGALYALNPRRRRSRRRRGSRRGRRRNPGALYALNRPRRRRGGRRRRNPILSGGMGGLVAQIPQVIGFRLPVGGLLGRIGNGIVQSTAAGGVVFGGFVLSSFVVNKLDAKLHKADGSAYLGKFQRPILLAGMAGGIGTLARFAAKFLKGSPGLWFILGAAGPGLAAVASLLDQTMDKQKSAESGGIVYRINKIATGLADYIQVGDEALEAGVNDYVETGDYIQVGDEALEAGVSDDSEIEETVEDAF